MRPVNLIPPEQRRGDFAPTRTGGVAYLVVGGLCLLLIGVVVLVLTGNQISDRRADVARLQTQLQSSQARADSVASYTQFASVEQARTETVSSLADSRFDWQRVLREVSLVTPSDVWLINLTGTASPAVAIDNSADIETRASVPGPALSIIGCAPSQEAVAGYVAALRDIDGVTRVGVAQSDKPDATAGPAGGASDQDCRTQDFISKFEIVAAFDQAPTPMVSGGAPATAPTAPAPSGSTATPASSSSTTTGSADSSGSTDSSRVGQVQKQQQGETASVNQASQKAQQAIGLVRGSGN
jgi:Tfp pilus assembly protein PilN